MIFRFPEFDTLRFAIQAAIVPPRICLAPVQVGYSADGSITLEPIDLTPAKALQLALKRLGVVVVDAHDAPVINLRCWLQAIPLQKTFIETRIEPQTPILFSVPDEELQPLVQELLRLGNDRIGYRANPAAAPRQSLLKVIGPPYYTLLRAIDRVNGMAEIVAYRELSPRVWVELGYDHPFAAQLQAPENQALLLRHPQSWAMVDDGPFEDIYRLLDVALPTEPIHHQNRELKGKLSVPLKLLAGHDPEGPELWVLNNQGVEILDAFVRESDQNLIRRFRFAIVPVLDAEPIVVLRVRDQRPSSTPPTIALDNAIAYRSRRGLENLFLPLGMRLQPSLRKDLLDKLFFPSREIPEIVWLAPTENDRFVPESLAESAFRPLEEWVEYIIDRDRQTLGNWIAATTFDFDSFLCREDSEPPANDSDPGRGRSRKPPVGDLELPKHEKKQPAPPMVPTKVVIAPPTELRRELEAVEQSFLSMDCPLDAAERQALWPTMARLNSQLGRQEDASLAWLSHFWETPEPPFAWVQEWFLSEIPSASVTPNVADLDRCLANTFPLTGEVRQLIALLRFYAGSADGKGVLQERLPELGRYLESHEALLPIRAVWLAWIDLARTGGEDVLSLTRARDRLLNRLLQDQGLRKELDLPQFMRLSGNAESARLRTLCDHAYRLHDAALAWGESVAENAPYFDLIFAFGMACLGEGNKARELQHRAASALAEFNSTANQRAEVHSILLSAFSYRIDQILGGNGHRGALPQAIHERIEALANASGSMNSLARYPVDHLRQQLWILEPQEQLDARNASLTDQDPRLKELSQLPNLHDPIQLSVRITKLLRAARSDAEIFLITLQHSLWVATRVDERFTVQLLQQVATAVRATVGLKNARTEEAQRRLIERALFLAGHYGQTELANDYRNLFQELLVLHQGKELHEDINAISRECLHSMRKLGLQPTIHELLARIAERVIGGKSIDKLRGRNPKEWAETLRCLLALAEGWLHVGETQKALPFLEEARLMLFRKDHGLLPLDYTKLVRAYVNALGQGRAEQTLAAIEELLAKMHRFEHQLTTAAYYSRLHLNVVEDVVRTLISDPFTLSESTRRWLEEDEYLVRRRIHRDLKAILLQNGL